MRLSRDDRRFWVALFAVIAIAACGLGAWRVHHRQAILRLGYKLSAATEKLQKAREENRRLRLERSVLTNPARIEKLAGSLGLIQPEPASVRVIPAHQPGGAARKPDEAAHKPDKAAPIASEATP